MFAYTINSFVTVLPGICVRRNIPDANGKEVGPTIDKIFAEHFNVKYKVFPVLSL
jgi:hypothetical protein